jgi:hypothetical protein
VEKVLRGTIKPQEKLAGHHAAHQRNEPTFPVGKVCLIAASKAQGDLSIKRIEEADDAKIVDVEKLCAMPVGWKTVDGKVVSPWSTQNKMWPATSKLDAKLGPDVKLQVEPVPPKKSIEWSNPDGDGEYKVTVTNTNDKQEIEVPALLSDGKQILWEESLVILCQKKTYPCPDSKGVTSNVVATKLKPGESVSTVVNTFRLEGPDWPKGGYRIEFQFCLGEASQTKSFYYLSKHHDPIHAAAKGSSKQE